MTIFHLTVALSVLLASVAQMLLKKGASTPHSSVFGEYANLWVISGYVIMLASLLIDVWAIGHGVKVKEVSTIESLSYLFVPLLGYMIFGESISWRKLLSIALIMAGIVVFFL